MKTFDGAELALRHFNNRIASYPANSVSRREVVCTVPGGDEKIFARLDAKITKLLQADAAAVVAKNNNQALKFVPSEELERVTALVRKAAS